MVQTLAWALCAPINKGVQELHDWRLVYRWVWCDCGM